MKNSLRILLVLAVIVGVLPILASAYPINDTDVSVCFKIDDGDQSDLHAKNGWLVAGSGTTTSTIQVACAVNMSVIHYVRFTSLEKDTYGDVVGDRVTTAPYNIVFSASENVAGDAPIQVQINYTDITSGIGNDYYRTVYQRIDHNIPLNFQNISFEGEVTLDEEMDITMVMEDAYGNTVNSLYEDATGGTPESVTLSTTSHAGSGFYNDTGYGTDVLTVPVSAEGSVVATFKTGTEAGPKYLIHIVPSGDVHDKWLTITALANGKPYEIRVSVNPKDGNPPSQPADGESKFYLTYNLFDKYGNPSCNHALDFSEEVTGRTFTWWTNSDGEVKVASDIFGTFDTATTLTVHAEAKENPFVAVDQKLRFVSTAPEGMYLMANPQSMASADARPDIKAQILAKVTDESGNGVPGEEVNFILLIPDGGFSAAQEVSPSLDASTAFTNADGIAVVNFTPGEFIQDSSDENYLATASESCDILATWGTKSQKIDLTWRNYPYLRVETEVSPETVEVGGAVDATIRLTGDGWALYPSPIDVMLCADRSGSMLEDNPDRMVSAMDAMKIFNGKMTEGRDRIGLTSFGINGSADIYDYWAYYWPGDDSKENYMYNVSDESECGNGNGYGHGHGHGCGNGYYEYYNSSEDIAYINAHYLGNGKTYADYATLDLCLTNEIDTANQTISQLVPMGGTPMRHGLYFAINELIENGDPDAVKAIVLVSDGDYDTGGDPLARDESFSKGNCYRHQNGYCNGNCYRWRCGSDYPCDYYYYDDLSSDDSQNLKWQNLSVYANDHDITIYSIAFGNGLTEDGTDTLKTLATSTGGLYKYAPTGEDLAAIYLEIAGELRTEAGVDTTMDLMFTDIELNNETEVNGPDNRILEYQSVDNLSTLIKSWNTVLSPQWSEDSDNVVRPLNFSDQTNDWENGNQKLTFDATEIGTINLGQVWQTKFRLNVTKPGNINIFDNRSLITFNGEDTLPIPKTYITAVLNATGIDFTGLQVSDLVCVEVKNGDVISSSLTMEWNLNYSGTNNVTQNLYYHKVGDGIWTNFNKMTVPGPVPVSFQTGQLCVADFPPGEYKLRVRAMADDAPDSVIETSETIVIGQGGDFFIRLG
ncbi:hypothetical protein L0665_04380 [Methanogenium marinum]|uniref:VWFA domain-containing protein n=1 Tax=Methanogenium marinum TaxID=348610 RepID=A0A9Q4KNU1_9EURY|nr:hypothetical protein [Methanogenium marinum]MDE4907848.1 hypothetical protein [Methanogenium marinum]